MQVRTQLLQIEQQHVRCLPYARHVPFRQCKHHRMRVPIKSLPEVPFGVWQYSNYVRVPALPFELEGSDRDRLMFVAAEQYLLQSCLRGRLDK